MLIQVSKIFDMNAISLLNDRHLEFDAYQCKKISETVDFVCNLNLILISNLILNLTMLNTASFQIINENFHHFDNTALQKNKI